MNTASEKHNMTNPDAFVGKRIDPNKWNIPAGYGLCRMTQKLHRDEELEVTFAHWKFEDAFLHEHGIYVEDAEALSEEGFDLIRAKLEELGMWDYYLEYPYLPFPGSTPEAPAEIAPVETLNLEYEQHLDTVALTHAIQDQAYIRHFAAAHLAAKAVEFGYTGGAIVVGVGDYGFDTALYVVIWQAGSEYRSWCGYLRHDGGWQTVDCGQHRDVRTLRWVMTYTYQARLCDVNPAEMAVN